MREPKFILTIVVVIVVTATVVPLILYYNDVQDGKKRAQVTTNTASSYDANHVLYIDRSTVLLSNGKPKTEVKAKPAVENNTFGIKKDKVENVANTVEEVKETFIDVIKLPKEEYGYEGKIINEPFVEALSEDSRSFLIKNYDGLKLFASDYGIEGVVDLYTDNTFDYKNLAIRYIPCLEGDNELSFYSVSEENNILYVDYSNNYFKDSSINKKGYLLVFEVNKNIIEIEKK